jgi:pimeloyl-ACP methyl ester carboxylesterase
VKRFGIWAAALALAVTMAGPASAQLARIDPWKSLRETAPLPYTKEKGLMEVGDVKLYYAVYGKGPPVILLHTGLGHSDYWANQVGPLSQDYQVVLVDLRGHGRSTRSDKPFSYDLLGEDVLVLMQKLHIGKAAIVGWGDGAVTALDLAMRHPGRVRELILFGVTYDLTGQRPDVDKSETFIQYVHKTAEDYQRMSPKPEAFDALFQQMEAMWATQPNFTAAQLGKIDTPTTIMVAEHDEWVRRDHAEQLAGIIPNAQLVVLPDVSHFAPWQASKKFNDVVKLALRY